MRSVVILSLVLVLLVAWMLHLGTEKPAASPPAPVASAPPQPPATPPASTAKPSTAKPSAAALSALATIQQKVPPAPPPTKKPDHDELQAPELSWDNVDMEAVRALKPNNRYWTMSAPTKDPEVLRKREEEQEHWNTEYGKVLSNTATAEEIDAYYDYRQKVANDNIAFAGYLLAAYGGKLPERDVALLKLAVKLNLARLEEYPRQIVEAQQRREEHDAARRAWLADQQAFEDKQQQDVR
jgi:hypothetical protein